MLLAEAGTGIGKRLGYLAPASLWASGTSRFQWSPWQHNLDALGPEYA